MATAAPEVVTGSDRLADWHTGVAALQWLKPPEGFTAERWRVLQLDAAQLLEDWGPELVRLGWSDTDVWGICPVLPGCAVHRYGLAVCINGGWVIELTVDAAVIQRRGAARLTYRRQGLEGAVVVWSVHPRPSPSDTV